jgi:glyoxylase-like metal-dependent hydrolase (beta-lactamase superfamily II)
VSIRVDEQRYQDWYEVERIGDGVVRIAEPLHEEGVKAYLVEGERAVAVIDTGLGVGDFGALVRELSDKPPLVLQTHGHWDHIGGSHAFERVLVHPSEAYALRRGFPNAMYRPLFTPQRLRGGVLPSCFDPETAAIPGVEPTGDLNHGDTIDLGGRVLEAIHTPGHSPGGIALLERATGFLFAGDIVNEGDIWLFLPRSDAADFRATMRLLADMAGDITAIYPSHGKAPQPPGLLPEIRDAFEEVWAGRAPDRRLRWDIGFPERVPVDVHDFGTFRFLLGEGRYGEGTGDE